MKFLGKIFENWQFWKTQFFWVGRLRIIYSKKKFCFIPMKNSQSFLGRNFDDYPQKCCRNNHNHRNRRNLNCFYSIFAKKHNSHSHSKYIKNHKIIPRNCCFCVITLYSPKKKLLFSVHLTLWPSYQPKTTPAQKYVPP